jgi:hypothetical protein
VTNTKGIPDIFTLTLGVKEIGCLLLEENGMKKSEARFLKSSFLLDFFPIYWVESFTTPVLTSLTGHGEKSEDMIDEKEKIFQNKGQKRQ